MKSLSATLLITALLASCGGGGGGGGESDEGQAPNDEGSPVTPLTPLPVTPPVIDTAPQLGALSDLIGVVGIAYGFNDTAPVFGLGVEFSADDLMFADGGIEFLFGSAVTLTRLSPTSEDIRGRNMFLGCSFSDSMNQFLCILDSDGANESVFTFSRLVNGSAQGSFEFCNGVTIVTCTTSAQFSPDGNALIGVSDPQAASSVASKVDSEKTDLLPYLQYLKQGSSEEVIVANSRNGHVDALIADVKNLKEALSKE